MSSDNCVNHKVKSKIKRLPMFVMPDSKQREDMINRLKYWTQSSNKCDWIHFQINSKTRKYLSRNGFHMLFWSSLIIDERLDDLVNKVFKDNIKYITDEEFESNFGIPLDTNDIICDDQLFANYFLLFSLPAKSHTEYVHEWAKRRLKAWTESVRRRELCFDAHQELFVETKRRFYVHKELVPALTRFAINSFNQFPILLNGILHPLKEIFRQIQFAIKYSGLQAFQFSWDYSQFGDTLAMDLMAVKDDIKRITEARNAIIEKYGENLLPYARLLNLEEVSQLDRCHYPDLAFCAYYAKRNSNQIPFENFKFRTFKTKTPIEELKRVSLQYKALINTNSRPVPVMDFSIVNELSLDRILNQCLPTFTNPYDDLDFLYDDPDFDTDEIDNDV